MTTLTVVYDEFINYLVEKATPDEILAFQPSPEAISRAESLTEKNKTGQLSQIEQDELEQMLALDNLVSLLKARALVAKQAK
jgi:hypothetical protein